MKKRRMFRYALGAFIILFIVLLFFYRTVYSWTLPQVKLVFSESGKFIWTVELRGVAEPTDEYDGCTHKIELFVPDIELPDAGTVIRLEDKVVLDMPYVRYAIFIGYVKTVANLENGALMTVGFTSQNTEGVDINFKDGEETNAWLTKESDMVPCIVPVEAVFNEYGEKYVYTVEQRPSVFGRVYVEQKRTVATDYSQYGKVMLKFDSPIDEPIVWFSDRPLSEGDRVRFYP